MLLKSKPVASETKNPSMAKPNHARQLDDEKRSPPQAAAAWGTWEELLLAYAVNRYGTKSWDSISSELRKRTSAAKLFTPKLCKQKYLELERRFDGSIGDDDDSATATTTATAAAVPWIEELRKLRVEELQRKLQKFDIYISSLQLKVKKLTEENTDNDCGETMKTPDLGQKIDDIEIKNVEEVNNKRNPVKSGEERVSGDDENQSVNGSNGNVETGEKSENESSPAEEKPESSPVGVDDSGDGRPDGNEPVKTEPDSGEPESISESKSGGTIKENSDVQSSASKSRKEDRVRRGCSKGDGREDEDQPLDSIPVRSLPLIDVLQKVHHLGSAVFDRRLDRQEKARYKKLIREHIDFEILQTRLKNGSYSDGNNKFFRDLLLLVNNTFVFFSNESPQSIAAIQLRQFILNQKQKTDSKSKPTISPPKPKIAGPMIVCRKRSSIAAKSSGRKETRISDGFPPISKKILESLSSGSENSEVKSGGKEMKDKKPVEMEEKRGSGSKFLINRMNRSSSAANNVAAGGGSEEDCGGGERKRGGQGKKEEAVKRGSGGRQSHSPAKRSVGRPPKRAAAAQTPAGGGLGKRNWESGESEPLISKQAKKRSKRFY